MGDPRELLAKIVEHEGWLDEIAGKADDVDRGLADLDELRALIAEARHATGSVV